MDKSTREEIFNTLWKAEGLDIEIFGSDMLMSDGRPYDLESKMLDWLEEQKDKDFYYTMSTSKDLSCIHIINYGINDKQFKWNDVKPRPVAIAEAVVWVKKQLELI